MVNNFIKKYFNLKEVLIMWKKLIFLFLVIGLLVFLIGCGGGNPVVPPGDETTTEEEYNTITQIGGSAAEEFLNFEDIYGEEQALQKTVDYLNQQEGIESVSLDEESGTVSFEFENGHLGIIITHDVTKSSKLEAGKGELPFPIERIRYLSKGTPTEEKALLLNPFPTIFVGNSAQYIKGKLEAIGYQCDYYEGEEVTVELMKNMEDYGVIYIDTHGGVVNTHYGKEVDFVIGQKGSKQLYQQYDSDLMLHRLGHVWIPSLSLSHYFCILPHFIGEYAETSYPNNLIYIDACNSYKNPTMAEAFIDAGAYVYCGYSSLILAFNYSERKVFDNMIDEDMTIQGAVDEVGASNLHFHPEDREDFCLVEEDEISITISNSSFENPTGCTDNGLLNGVDDWIEGGSWYGRVQWADGVPDGEYAVWSSIFIDGCHPELGIDPNNGFSQELSTVFEEGRYTLRIKALGDNTAGLTSRLILGYDSGNNNYVELAHQDTNISYDPDSLGFSYQDAWFNQELVFEVIEGSAVIGKPIWIRFTSITADSDTWGNSCWWDDISLTIAYPID
jgi:hypothetical protein